MNRALFGPSIGSALVVLAVTLGVGGRLAVFCGQAEGGVHLVLDVNGYFE